MNKIVYLFVLLLLVGCGSDDDDKVHEPPIFKSSTPDDGAINVELDTEINVVFDEVVSLSSPHNITINGSVANVEAGFTKIIFDEVLEENTTYSIVIPKSSVINSFGVSLQEDVSFSFTTKEEEQIEDVVIAEHLVTDYPSSEAVNVYNFLKENYGSKIVSAAQSNVAWNINEAEWVKQHTGEYPAMATFDYIQLPHSPANWIDYSDISFVKEWWNNNGIIAASWHWLVPPTQSETDPFKFTYKNETTFKPSNVVIDGTWENGVAKADFDKIISYIKLLQDENIPMIWRPLHEAAGNIYEYNNGTAWFWWGSEGAEAYKALWQFMFDYFKEQGVNNLIWVWTTQTKDDDFYPGDEYVDIIGRDIYDNSDSDEILAEFTSIQETYSNKMVTLSECGSVAHISDQWASGAKWSYYMPWYDYERTNDVNEADFSSTDHEHANALWWQDAMQREYVITRDEMPSLK